MLAKLSRIFFSTGIIFFTTLLAPSCKNNPDSVGISSVNINLKMERFDLALTENPGEPVEARLAMLRKEYGNFFNRFTDDIIHINNGDSVVLVSEFKRFLADPDFNEVTHAVKDTFKDATAMEKIFGNAFGRYKYYFPEKKIPEVIGFVSLFNYAIINTDSVLGIGLDMYLGSQSKYYPALGFPVYKISKMSREYIPADAMRGWMESEFEPAESKHDFLGQMIHHGKILYLLKAMMPEENDTLLTGYSSAQLKWCYENEKSIWAFFVEKQLLFSSNSELFSKYLSEGPTTNGFPAESPGNIGTFVGWQIIKAYMKENPEISPARLMKETDATIILKDSKYKPKK